MNKHELIAMLAQKAGITKKSASEILDTFIDIVVDELKKGKEVTVTGFGTFKITNRKGREGVNPQNLDERIKIPPMKRPAFRPGKTFKDAFR